MKILGIIPARGGSKEVPRKNLQLVAGKPLIAYAIEVARKSTLLPRTIVSTEDEEIARRYGLRFVSCNTPGRLLGQMVILGNEQVVHFHDREIVLHGLGWLQQLLDENRGKRLCFVRELGR